MTEKLHLLLWQLNILYNAHHTYSNGVLGAEALLRNYPHPEAVKNVLLDLHHQAFQQYPHGPSRGQANDSTGSSLSNSHRWSDCTLTGSVSGQCSTYSWGLDEAVRDALKMNEILCTLITGLSESSCSTVKAGSQYDVRTSCRATQR